MNRDDIKRAGEKATKLIASQYIKDENGENIYMGVMAIKIWNAAIEEAIKFMVTNRLEEGLYDRMRKELKKGNTDETV